MTKLFAINPETGRWVRHGSVPSGTEFTRTLTTEEGYRIAASVVPGLTEELVAALDRTVTADDTATGPQARVESFLAALKGRFVLIAEAQGHPLEQVDVRDLVNELTAWRALAASRLAVAESLAQQVVTWQATAEALQAANVGLGVRLLEFVDPAPQERATGGNI